MSYPLDPPLDFMQELWHLNHALERMSLHMERSLGVTAQQRLFIRCLGKYPGMTATQLAGVLHLDRGTVSVALRRLMAKGLITKRTDPRDSRRVSLGLTPRGRRLDVDQPVTVEHSVAQLISKAGNTEVSRVKRLLRQLAEDLLNSASESKPMRQAHGGTRRKRQTVFPL